MSFHDVISTQIRELVAAGVPAANITAPLINGLAHVLVAANRSVPADIQKESLEGMVEIARNELDEAVVHYDKILPR